MYLTRAPTLPEPAKGTEFVSPVLNAEPFIWTATSLIGSTDCGGSSTMVRPALQGLDAK